MYRFPSAASDNLAFWKILCNMFAEISFPRLPPQPLWCPSLSLETFVLHDPLTIFRRARRVHSTAIPHLLRLLPHIFAEGDATFTVFYEPQDTPRHPNECVAGFLPPSVQWLGNILVVKHMSCDTPMHAKP